MNILVTGGAGFIGSNFVKKVLDGTFQKITKVTVIDKLTYSGNLSNFSKSELSNFEFIKGDICNNALTLKLVKNCSAVINFAAESHVDRSISNSKNFIKTNIVGTQNLLQLIKAYETKIFVQVSTDEVYGSINKGYSNELQSLSPNSPYAATKAAAELIALSYYRTYGLDIRISRGSNTYGPFQYPEKLIPLFITNLINGKKLPLYGDGSNIREWLYVDDHCMGIYKILVNGKRGEAYNLGSGIHFSNFEIANKLARFFKKNKSVIEFVPDRLGHDMRYALNSNKAKKDLGFKADSNFENKLNETVSWYINNKKWWENLSSKKVRIS